MKLINTAEAAGKLGVTANRVRALIRGKLVKASRFGRDWLIDPKDLSAVKKRTPGRPKSRNRIK